MTIDRSKSKPEVEFQYGARSFSETGTSYNSQQPWNEISVRNLAHVEILAFWGYAHHQTATGS